MSHNNSINNSTSSIDLMYLTNINNTGKSSSDLNKVNRKDVEFYKKRIFQLCKDLLRGKKEYSSINDAFDEFCLTAIDHFKMVDRSEIIQNEYKNLDLSSLPNQQLSTKILEENPDELMFKKIEKNNDNTMDKFVIKNIVKKDDSMVMPTKKNFNLKDVKYQEKDIEVKSKSSAVAMKNKKNKNKNILKTKQKQPTKQKQHTKQKQPTKQKQTKQTNKKYKNVIDLNIN